MVRLILVAILALVLPMASKADCTTTPVTSSFESYVDVSGSETVSISFEPDALGSETVATITLEICSRRATTSCLPYNFDTDADGLGDTNILDASTIEKTGVKAVKGFRYMRIAVGTAPSGTDDPEVTVCYGENQ